MKDVHIGLRFDGFFETRQTDMLQESFSNSHAIFTCKAQCQGRVSVITVCPPQMQQPCCTNDPCDYFSAALKR